MYTHYEMYVFVFQYQLDGDQLSEKLTVLNNSLDPKSVSLKSNPEMQLQLEVQQTFTAIITETERNNTANLVLSSLI